jgi:hypothetical protein
MSRKIATDSLSFRVPFAGQSLSALADRHFPSLAENSGRWYFAVQ